MSDTPPERNSNSKSNLIEVQHVGVTAKLQSPLKNLLQTSSSSTETENGNLYNSHHKTKYNKFSNDTPTETESTSENSRALYEMRAVRASTNHASKVTPSKIEFQLYNKTSRHNRRTKPCGAKKKKPKPKLFDMSSAKPKCCDNAPDSSVFQRLRYSLDHMCAAKPKPKRSNNKIFEDLPEPPTVGKASPPRETQIGIYPFEHGCADYLRTSDSHPTLLSMVLAERATRYATRFWAEFFGTLHIGVTFVVTFLLQSYRFFLYSLVNTLIVGFLHMTSDYLIKPILTVLFNGFLQPPLILIYNVLASVRDLLEPVADTVNNFMRPVATVGKSIRLVHATYNHRKFSKEV